METHVRQTEPFRWEGIDVLKYKEEGTHFKSITRQILFEGGEALGCQLRYFEIEPGGHSTLEKHQHVHSVLVVRGSGRALVGDRVHALKAFDMVYVPAQTWHQFRASGAEPLGFLCMVACDRDRPVRPREADLAEIRRSRDAAEFIRV